MERPTARNLPAHRPQRKHGEPPNSHMELGRRGGGAGRLFIRYFGASGPLIRCMYSGLQCKTSVLSWCRLWRGLGGKVLERSRVALAERDSWMNWPLHWTLK